MSKESAAGEDIGQENSKKSRPNTRLQILAPAKPQSRATNEVIVEIPDATRLKLHANGSAIHPVTTAEHLPSAWYMTGEKLLAQQHRRSRRHSFKVTTQERAVQTASQTVESDKASARASSDGPATNIVNSPQISSVARNPLHWHHIFVSSKHHTLASRPSTPPRHLSPSYVSNLAPPQATPSSTTGSFTPGKPPSTCTIRVADPQHRQLPRLVEQDDSQAQLQNESSQYESEEDEYSRPRTPNGTLIRLPADINTARRTRLEADGYVDVQRLAHWASHNADWAEYLRSGGGNDEAWWLYRRIKRFPGYKVSGWHEIYENKSEQEHVTGEGWFSVLDDP